MNAAHSSQKTLLAAILMVFLTSFAVLAADPMENSGEGMGPIKLNLASGGCQNCLKPNHGRPTCATSCDMLLTAVVQNQNHGSAVTVEVTMLVHFPWTPGSYACQPDVVQVQTVTVNPDDQVSVDFLPALHGSFRMASFVVTTLVVASDDAGLIGKTSSDSIPIRAFWPYCAP